MKLITIIITIFIVFTFETVFAFPDLMDIKHISAIGRVQDKKYNPGSPIIDELIKNGKSSVPFLIKRLKSKNAYGPGVLDFWPYVEERHVALIILTDFFLDPTWQKSTLPDLCYITILEKEKYPNLAEQDILRFKYDVKKWDSLIDKWEAVWFQYQEDIVWDSEGRYFKILGRDLEECQ